MKIARPLGCLLLSLMSAASVIAAEVETEGWRGGRQEEPRVTLYERPHFRGEAVEIFVGDEIRDLRGLRFPDGSRVDDRVSSIEVSRGVQIRLYENDGFRGEFIELSRSVDNLSTLGRAGGRDWNDVVSSLRVGERRHSQPRERDPSRTPRVIVFSRKNYTGEAFEIYPGENLENLNRDRFESGTDLNDEISSIRIVGPLRVRLYLETRYRGEYVDITGDVTDFNQLRRANPKQDWNDKASSLTVEWLGPPDSGAADPGAGEPGERNPPRKNPPDRPGSF